MTLFRKFANLFASKVLIGNADKAFIIGGYDLQGAYCNWLINMATGRGAQMIVDDTLCVYGVKVYRELALETLAEKDKFIGIVPHDRKYEEMFKRHGIEYIVLEDIFGCEGFGFYEWLEAEYGVDLVKTIAKETFDYDFSFATNSGASRQMGLTDVITYMEQRLLTLSSNARVLDVGCGKGGAITLLTQSVFSKVDGIEMSKSICETARKNMEQLGINAEIINGSATEFDRYDEYDILYLYDPFRDDVFRQALEKFEEAALKRKKPMLLVYANPYHHKDIIKGGVFSLISAVDTDFFHRDVYIYSSEEVK